MACFRLLHDDDDDDDDDEMHCKSWRQLSTDFFSSVDIDIDGSAVSNKSA